LSRISLFSQFLSDFGIFQYTNFAFLILTNMANWFGGILLLNNLQILNWNFHLMVIIYDVTLVAQSACMSTAHPIMCKSGTRQRILSTQYTWIYLTPRCSSDGRRGQIAS
jgi:hypothetical protein